MAITQQTAWGFDGRDLVPVMLPLPESDLLSGVKWGRAEELFTPAFWKYQVSLQRAQGRYGRHRLGDNLLEEVSACLLGGYGLSAELALAAFLRLKSSQLLAGAATSHEIEVQLSEPFLIDGLMRRYRFPRQKARYLSSALKAMSCEPTPKDSHALRSRLLALQGIGPKTASWIVRNHLGADDVAILDVHVIRAGVMIGLFCPAANLTRDYFVMERRFLDFCDAVEEPASVMDAVIWDYMRQMGTIARRSASHNATSMSH